MRYSDDMPNWFIDAKELWKMLIQQREENKESSLAYMVNIGINQAVGIMNRLPAADVVEVVRCKDCKHRGSNLCPMETVELYPWFGTKNDAFCSYGERGNND